MLPFVEPKYYNLTANQKTALLIAASYSESFLRFIPRQIKNFPSHGVDHTLNIIELINKFLERWEIKLSRNERFLLYLAAWLHDIGCIRSRKRHNRESVKLLEENGTLCTILNGMDNEAILNLRDIILSHTRSYKIENIPKKRGKIRTQLLCSIFRLMDACEVTRYKCPIEVYSVIKGSFKKRGGVPDNIAIQFWEGHMNISEIEFVKPSVFIYMKNQRKSENIILNLKEEIESIKKIFLENNIVIPKVGKKSQ